ncbi:DUF5722 domain-containing protein [Alienimonas chondri]|uniref:DUF5722 domain-containing protein n=1 Tax=Alienimonas chondri TaxID=2681879 RepID=A0ABX1V9G6_9PLAN|nr:DUF5722 domain-containing protein [Alienimonas chondri]NNJ24689.1 hypothetical protein [Alienimonas chondri]
MLIPTLVPLLIAVAAPQGGAALSVLTNSAHDADVAAVEGGVRIATTGNDPYVFLAPFAPDFAGPEATRLTFEYRAPAGVNDLRIYYGSPITADKSFSAGRLEPSQVWRTFTVDLVTASGGGWTLAANQLRLDFGDQAGVQIGLRGIRLRPANEAERRASAAQAEAKAAKLRDEAAIRALLEDPPPAAPPRVSVGADSIEVAGRTDRPATLLELRPWIRSTRAVSGDGVRVVAELPAGPFDLQLPRVEAGTDRVTSRWALAESAPDGDGWTLQSAARHPESIPARHPLERLTPRSIKGLGGLTERGPRSDWEDLGLHNGTINVPLNLFLRTEPGPGRTPFEHDGRTWYVVDQALHRYDEVIEAVTDRGIVLSAILLIPYTQTEFGRLLAHPEAGGAGIYAMPNLDTPEGVVAYGAAVALLSERYSRPVDGSQGAFHGRISNWILHNEIDRGVQWTNMGAQPPLRYLETYYRAMRLVHALARRNDPHARTFISLTHYWDEPADPTWRTYAPRRLLEDLAALSRQEGDFEWGVAYHPYPQSLLRPTPWSDPLPTEAEDTPMITTRNLGVLERFLHREDLLFRPPGASASGESEGRVRGVLLSEQGFHTPETTDPAERETHERTQAAAFLYTWDRLRELTVVEAFHNHRWIDHPNEGPLRLGLRRLPTTAEPHGPKKLAWEVYRDLGTPAEANWCWLLEAADAPSDSP